MTVASYCKQKRLTARLEVWAVIFFYSKKCSDREEQQNQKSLAFSLCI